MVLTFINCIVYLWKHNENKSYQLHNRKTSPVECLCILAKTLFVHDTRSVFFVRFINE